MRESGLLSILAILAAALILGCATGGVTVEQHEDLEGLRTWNWLPPDGSPQIGVRAPHRDAARLHAHLARLIEKRLRAQGFARDPRADFFVIYQLVLEPRKVAVHVPRAPYLLSSMDSSPSYWIEGSDEKIRVYEDFKLVIAVLTRAERIVWRAVLEQKVQDGKDLSLAAAVAVLLARLPPPAAGPGDEPHESEPPAEAPSNPLT